MHKLENGMGFIRDRIEDHLIQWSLTWDNQFGFTKGGRIEHNLLILQFIANKAYDKRSQYNKQLLFAMIDFRKAYDSVNRWKLIQTLVKFKVHYKIIDKIVAMYSNDETTITLGNLEEKIKVTSGIRQSCSISTLLFKMITFCIIEELTNKGIMYHSDGISMNSIWLADDVTLIANSIANMNRNIDIEEGSIVIWAAHQ